MNAQRNMLAVLLALSIGCAGYVDQTARMRSELRLGNPEGALADVNSKLGIDSLTDEPDLTRKNATLLMLERATLLQSMERHKTASQTFQTVDDQLEVLDLTKDDLGAVAKYLYSDDAKVYKAPAFEKLLLNPLNMLNYLILENRSAAKVEARRFDINRNFFKERNRSDPAVEVFGSYLSGIAFEQAGEPEQAMRFYADAYGGGGLSGLERVIQSLHQRTGATDPRVRKVYADPSKPRRTENTSGEVVVIVQEGLVPRRVAKRLPIGLAVTRFQGDPVYQQRLSPKQRAQAQRIAAKGLVTWVNFPQLEVGRGSPTPVRVRINRSTVIPNVILNVKAAAIRYFKKHEGLMIVAAIARTITRAIAASATEAISERAGGSGPVGFLLGLALQGTMTAADTPDTRGWVSLPARIHHVRKRLPVGTHTLSLRIGSRNFTKRIDIKNDQLTVINFSRHRAGLN